MFCLCSLCKLAKRYRYGFCTGGFVGMLRPSLYCIWSLIELNGTHPCFCLQVFVQDGDQLYQRTFEANGWLVNFVGVQPRIVISHNIEVV